MIKLVVITAVVFGAILVSDISEGEAQTVTTYYATTPSVGYVPVRRGLFGLRRGYVPVVTGTVQVPVRTYVTPAPVTTFYAPAPAVTTFYAPAPVTTYYAPAPRTVTTFYAPAPRPVTTYYPPTVIINR